MKKLFFVYVFLFMVSISWSETTGTSNYSNPAIQPRAQLLEHTHYVDTNKKSLDYGAKGEFLLWVNEDSSVLLDEARIDVSHEVESNDTRIMVVGKVPLYKLWSK